MENLKNKYCVSVIIPTYNRSKLLSYTLESLITQKIDPDLFEVIVADDGSTDDTRSVLEKYFPKLNLKYVRQDDLGYRPGSARNLGIMASESKICLFIDSGVLLHDQCIKAHILFHQSNARSAAIGYIYGFEEDDVMANQLEQIINPSQTSKSIEVLACNDAFYDVREQHYIKYNDQIENLPAPWLYFWTGHVSALRSDLLEVDMFDPKYDGRWGVEDNDLGLRLHLAGVKISLLRKAKSVHYPHPKNKEDRHREGYANCIYFNNKFRTVETQLFLDHYEDKAFFDINEACIQLLEVRAKARMEESRSVPSDITT